MSPSDIPTVVEGTHSEQLDNELLLYFEEGTVVVALNPEACLVWRLCDGKRNLGEIEVLLSEAYPDAEDRIPVELREAIGELVEGGVIELVAATNRPCAPSIAYAPAPPLRSAPLAARSSSHRH